MKRVPSHFGSYLYHRPWCGGFSAFAGTSVQLSVVCMKRAMGAYVVTGIVLIDTPTDRFGVFGDEEST